MFNVNNKYENSINTSGWNSSPYIGDLILINNELIKNKEFKIGSIYNFTRKINLIGGEAVIDTDIIILTLDKTVGVILDDSTNIFKKQLNNFITLSYNPEISENNLLSYWETYNLQNNKKVTTNLDNYNLQSGRIEFIESQKIVVAWYEEKFIEKTIESIDSTNIVIENNPFNNFDIVEYSTVNTTKIDFISNASQVVVSAFSHGLANGDIITIKDVNGMTRINNNEYIVSDSDPLYTFKLKDMSGAYINTTDTSLYASYTDGGVVELKYRELSNKQLYYVINKSDDNTLNQLVNTSTNNKGDPIKLNITNTSGKLHGGDKFYSTHCIKMQLYESYEWIEGISNNIGSWYNQNKDKIYKIKDFQDIHVVNITGKLSIENISY